MYGKVKGRLIFRVFYELQGKEAQQKMFLAKFEEHRFAVRRGIVHLSFSTCFEMSP